MVGNKSEMRSRGFFSVFGVYVWVVIENKTGGASIIGDTCIPECRDVSSSFKSGFHNLQRLPRYAVIPRYF